MTSKVKMIKPENTLKKKVGSGGFNETDLIKAQAGIDKNEIDFRPLAQDLLGELDVVLKAVEEKKLAPGEQFNAIMYPMMQLKSQGGLFKYPLVSHISHKALDFLENIDGPDDDVIKIVLGYRNSVQAMIKLQLKEIESPVGSKLVEELEQAFARYKKAKGQ